jgi:hypothetical protein
MRTLKLAAVVLLTYAAAAAVAVGVWELLSWCLGL